MDGAMMQMRQFKIYWADWRFKKPGIYVYMFKANRRIIAVPKWLLEKLNYYH